MRALFVPGGLCGEMISWLVFGSYFCPFSRWFLALFFSFALKPFYMRANTFDNFCGGSVFELVGLVIFLLAGWAGGDSVAHHETMCYPNMEILRAK